MSLILKKNLPGHQEKMHGLEDNIRFNLKISNEKLKISTFKN